MKGKGRQEGVKGGEREREKRVKGKEKQSGVKGREKQEKGGAGYDEGRWERQEWVKGKRRDKRG